VTFINFHFLGDRSGLEKLPTDKCQMTYGK
jgi:hypothetical protein